MNETSNPYRVLHVYLKLASRRWRAGRPLIEVAKAFPHHITAACGLWHPDRMLHLISEVRAIENAHPAWDFPERPEPVPEDWIWQHADLEDLPHDWGARMQRRREDRLFAHDARGHQRAQLHDAGRPCIHDLVRDDLDGGRHVCRHCHIYFKADGSPDA